MIKLATVFSGIGAIEHALDRMGLQHKIVFACDNGDVDILNKEIAVHIDEISGELKQLKKQISAIGLDCEVEDLYKMQLIGMLNEALAEYEKTLKSIQEIPEHESALPAVLVAIIGMPTLKSTRKKEYMKFFSELQNGTPEQRQLKELQVILEISNDFKKDNQLENLDQGADFESVDGIKWTVVSKDLKRLYDFLEENNGKKIIRKVQDLAQRAGKQGRNMLILSTQDWKAATRFVSPTWPTTISQTNIFIGTLHS